MAATKKKKKWTKAMREAFARRMKRAKAAKSTVSKKKKRRVIKSKRKKTSVAKKATVKRTTKKGAPPMARKRKKGPAKQRKRRRSGSVGGKRQVINSLRDASIAVAGGVAAGIVANKLPITNATLKAASPIAIGAAVLLTVGRKNKLAAQMATGMMVLGGVAAIRAQFPSVPLLAGEEEIIISPDDYEDMDMLGYYPNDDYDDLSGPIDLAGPMDIADMSGYDDYDLMGEESSFMTTANM